MKNHLNRCMRRRIMYVENKDGTIEGVAASIGWVDFSKTGQTIYYRGLILQKGNMVQGISSTSSRAKTIGSLA